MSPQATVANRARYCFTFGDIGAEHAVCELRRRGYTLTAGWDWIAPADRAPSEEELFWIAFLIDEWDFGGLVEKGGSR